MEKTESVKGIRILFYLPLLLILASCGTNTKNLTYLNGIQDSVYRSGTLYQEPVIQVNDLLSIVISSMSQEASAIYNAPNESSYAASTASAQANRLTVGYLVDAKGDIQFPVLGKIHAAGMTKSQLATFIAGKLGEQKLLVDPIATIRHLNFRVSVLGEVARPGVFSIPNEKLTLLEALSFAGDITMYGKRETVLLIRENDKGEKQVKRIDMTDQRLLTSQYYYLQANDILYVEPSRNRLKRESNTMVIPIIMSAISLGIVAVTNLK